MDAHSHEFIKKKYDEGLSVGEIAKQVPYSLRDIISTIFFIETTIQVSEVNNNGGKADLIILDEFHELPQQIYIGINSVSYIGEKERNKKLIGRGDGDNETIRCERVESLTITSP